MRGAKRFIRRRCVQLYDVTSAVAGALDTGILETECFDALIITLNVAGAVSGLASVLKLREDASTALLKSATGLAIALHLGLSIGEDVNVSGDATVALRDSFPVPRRTQVTVAGAAGSTVRLTVEGVVKR